MVEKVEINSDVTDMTVKRLKTELRTEIESSANQIVDGVNGENKSKNEEIVNMINNP
jgi:hypothetical protein